MEVNRIVQVISIDLTPKIVGDQPLTRAVELLAAEDPAIRFRSDPATGRCMIAGVSERHLEIIIDLERRRAQVQFSDRGDEWRTVVALAPFGRLLGYTSELNYRSRGRATCSMHFVRYQQRDSFSDEGDRDSLVGAPLKPVVPSRESAIALPEPNEDDDPDEGWLHLQS